MKKIQMINNKGITLVALIVTVIVLIILAGVSMATLTGNHSLIGKAENVRELSENSAEVENETIGGFVNLIDNIQNQVNSGGAGDGTKLSNIASIGQYVNYDPTDVEAQNLGNTTYTSVPGSTTQHGNGYTTDIDGQTFSAGAYKASGGKWRILNIEGETITLISDPIYRDNENSTAMLNAADENGFYISNAIGYLWAEEELHRIGAIYGYGKGADTGKTVTYYYGGPNDQNGSIAVGTVEAQQGRKATLRLGSGGRALTVDDINKLCGVKETYKATYCDSTYDKNAANATYYPTLSNAADASIGVSAAQTSFNGTYYVNVYTYYFSDTTITEKHNEMINLGINYWLGSRCVVAKSNYAYFDVRCVYSEGYVDENGPCGLYGGSWAKYTPACAVRAVVTLKSGIQTTDEEYNESTGWNLK